MSMRERRAGYAMCVIATLLIASAVQAQSTITARNRTGIRQTASVDEADAIFARWDTAHDGTLSLEKFRAGWHKLHAAKALSQVRQRSAAMNTDKRGCLRAPEYAHPTSMQLHSDKSPNRALMDQCRSDSRAIGSLWIRSPLGVSPPRVSWGLAWL
jgi:hypothetical protein